MHLRRLKRFEFVALALLVLAGAAFVVSDGAISRPRFRNRPETRNSPHFRVIFATLRRTQRSWCAGGGLGRR